MAVIAHSSAPSTGQSAAAEPHDKPQGNGRHTACVSAFSEDAYLYDVRTEGRALGFCSADGAAEGESGGCYRLDLQDGWLAPGTPAADVSPPVTIETEAGEMRACLTGQRGCITLSTTPASTSEVLTAVSEDGRTLVVTYDLGERSAAETYDMKTGARIARWQVARESNPCPAPFFVGNTVYVELGVCAGPSAIGVLYTIDGKELAQVGGQEFWDAYASTPVHVDGPLWAFKESSGEEIVVHDVSSGVLEARIPLREPVATPTEPNSEPRPSVRPGQTWMGKLPGGKLVVVYGSELAGTVLVVDAHKRVIERRIDAPRCVPR